MASQDVNSPLIINPPTEVYFSGPALRSSRAVITLTNPTNDKIIFKIKTTAPSFYGVRPNFGVVMPNSYTEVEIARQPFSTDEAMKINHKFMVQSLVVANTVENYQKTWANASPNELGIAKLRCIFEGAKPGTGQPPLLSPPQRFKGEPKTDEEEEKVLKTTALGRTEPIDNKKPYQTDDRRNSLENNYSNNNYDDQKRSREKDDSIKKSSLLHPEERSSRKERRYDPRSENSEYINEFQNYKTEPQSDERNISTRRPISQQQSSDERNANIRKPVSQQQSPMKFETIRPQQKTSFSIVGTSAYSPIIKPPEKETSYIKTESSFVEKGIHSQLYTDKPISPQLSPYKLSAHKTTPKLDSLHDKEVHGGGGGGGGAGAGGIQGLRKNYELNKTEDEFTETQIAKLHAELIQLRAQNFVLNDERKLLKAEVNRLSNKSPILREYTIPHSELPQVERSVPLYYVIASMAIALLCVLVGKYIL